MANPAEMLSSLTQGAHLLPEVLKAFVSPCGVRARTHFAFQCCSFPGKLWAFSRVLVSFPFSSRQDYNGWYLLASRLSPIQDQSLGHFPPPNPTPYDF